jgi:hypothetical protein
MSGMLGIKKLWRYLQIDMQRAFSGGEFPLAIIIIALALNYNALNWGSAVEVARFIYSSVFVDFAMAVAVIPYGASYIDDEKHKYRSQMILRGNSNFYIASRIITVFLSSFVTFLLGYMIFIGYNILKLGICNEYSAGNMTGGNGAYLNLYLGGHYYLYVLMCGVHIACMAGLMGLLGMLAAQVVKSSIAVCIFPVVFVSLQNIAVQRIFGGIMSYKYSLRRLSLDMLSSISDGNSELRYYFIVACYTAVLSYVIGILNREDL